MRKVFSLLILLGCVNGDNTGVPDSGSDATTSDVAADTAIPTGAKLTLGVPGIWVAQNGQTQVPFTIARNGVNGALTVHATALPNGVTAADATVPDGTTTGTLSVAAGSTSKLGDSVTASIQLLDQTQSEDAQPLLVRVSGAPGTLDTTWGQNGLYSLALSSATVGYSLDVYPATAGADAGKVVVAGTQNTSSSSVQLVIARLMPDGTLDTTFGTLVADGGTTRLGYTLFDPGVTTQTYIQAVRIDSMGRVVVLDRLITTGGNCLLELGRWTPSGDLDTTFTRYSANLNGGYCGGGQDMRVMPTTDNLAVLAQWNIPTGTESVVQLFSGTNGTRVGTGYHLSLKTGTPSSMELTYMTRLRLDAAGGFILAGRQCDGGTNYGSDATACAPVIARLSSSGTLDASFGNSSGYTSFTFGTGLQQDFYGLAIDPTTKDILAAGANGDQSLSTLSRVSSTGLVTTFGSGGTTTPNLIGGAKSQALSSVMIDSASRIVAAGDANTTMPFLANLRMSASGTLDTTYGTNGIDSTTPGGIEEAALGNDDRLYVAGYSGTRLVVWRFWP